RAAKEGGHLCRSFFLSTVEWGKFITMANPIPILHGKGPPVPIDIRALRYFVETARLQSFTQAASSLSVTQSTVSKMVRQLENE
ncbi:LysR family transcriptional regulator, partial [Acinetobacter baumannii]|uniref:LysR family transcriptional regulator n=1 Tax=Acinetobacter baumannii TaxID=470 RepID=UPI001D1848AB